MSVATAIIIIITTIIIIDKGYLSCILHSFPHILLMERKEFPPEENY
jgi:hypothetical protein